MEVTDLKVEGGGDSAYGSSANHSRNSQGSIKSLTSTWSCSSGYDQPAKINGHNKENDVKNDLKSWQVKEFAAAINALTASACTKINSEICGDDRSLRDFPSSIDDGMPLLNNNNSVAGHVDSPFGVKRVGCPTTQRAVDDPAFVVAISLHDGVVLHVSSSITELLGYPKDMWIGRNLIDFVYPKDRIVFTTHVSKELLENGFAGASNGEAQQHSFHCRFRKYCGLWTSGFGLDNEKMAYRTFQLCTKLTNVGIGGDDRTGDVVGPATCMLAVITPVKSAYTVSMESTSMRSFTTRHSASCHFSHLDTSAIPYLGYLPQDILGNSIFDYYHPEDLPHLKQVYEQVLKEESRLYRSKPYRFLVRNGQYVLLETEWACFINPWSRKLEFIIGQHKIIKGPKEPDVFADASKMNGAFVTPDAVLEEGKNIQMEIKHILREAVRKVFEDSSKVNRKRRKELAKYVGNLLEEMVQTLDLDTSGKSFKEDESFSDHACSIVMGHISPHHQRTPSEPNSSATLPSYHRCNYDDNIQRYFDSRPKTHSTATSENRHSGGVSPPPHSTDDDDVVDDRILSPPADSGDDGNSPLHGIITSEDVTGSGSRAVQPAENSEDQGSAAVRCEIIVSTTSINLSQSAIPPSSSSSIALLSDVGCLPTNMCPSYVRVALTERILSKHNEVTEKSFVQQVRDIRSATFRDNDLFLPTFEARPADVDTVRLIDNPIVQDGRDRTNCKIIEPLNYVQSGESRLKRCGSHSPDLNTHKVNKHRHTNSPECNKFSNPIGDQTQTAINLWPPLSVTAASYSTVPVDVKSSLVVVVPRCNNRVDVVSSCPHLNSGLPAGCGAHLTGGGTSSWSPVQQQRPAVGGHLLVPVHYVRSIDDGQVCSAHVTEPRPFQSYPQLVPGVSLYQPTATVAAAAALASVLPQTPLTSTPTIASLQDRVCIGLHIGTGERKSAPDCKNETSCAHAPIKRPVVAAKLDFTNMMLSSSLFDLHRSKIAPEEIWPEKSERANTAAGSAQIENWKRQTTTCIDSAQPSTENDGGQRLKRIAVSTTELSNATSSSSSSLSFSSSSSSCHRESVEAITDRGGQQFDGFLFDDITGSSLNSFLKSDVDFSDCGTSSLRALSSAEESVNVRQEAVTSNDDDIANRKKAVRRSSLRSQRTESILEAGKESTYWMEELSLTRDVINGYRMPCRDIHCVLRDDVEKLRRMLQPDTVNEQLARLYDEVRSNRQQPENDDLIAVEDLDAFTDDDPVGLCVDAEAEDSCLIEGMLSGQDLHDIVTLYLLEDLEL